MNLLTVGTGCGGLILTRSQVSRETQRNSLFLICKSDRSFVDRADGEISCLDLPDNRGVKPNVRDVLFAVPFVIRARTLDGVLIQLLEARLEVLVFESCADLTNGFELLRVIVVACLQVCAILAHSLALSFPCSYDYKIY